MQARVKRALSQVAAGIECEVCQETFKTNWTLRRHHLAKHANQRPTIVCPEHACNESFTRWDSLERHFKSQHAGIKEPCPTCHKPFRKDYLHEHARVTGHYPQGKHITTDDARTANAVNFSTTGLHIDTQMLGSARVDDEMALQNSASTEDNSSASRTLWETSSTTSGNGATSLLTMQTSPTSSSSSISDGKSNDVPALSLPQDPSATSSGVTASIPEHAAGVETLAVEEFTGDAPPNVTGPCNLSQDMVETSEPGLAKATDESCSKNQSRKDQLHAAKFQFRHRLRSANDCDDRPPSIGGTCVVCNERLGSCIQDVASHLKGHLITTPIPRNSCSVCGIAFVFPADLHRHRRVRSHYIHHDLVKTSSLDCDLVRLSTHHTTDSWLIDKFRADYLVELREWERCQICSYVDSFEVSTTNPPYDTQQLFRQNFRSVNAIGFRKREQIYGSCAAVLRTGTRDDRLAIGELVDRFASLAMVPEAAHHAMDICTASTSPLILALCDGMRDVVKRIVRLRNSHICDYCEQYAICWASGRGDRDSVQLLLECSPLPSRLLESLDLGLPGIGPLEYAMQQAKHAVVDLLLAQGARITRVTAVHEVYLNKSSNRNDVARMQAVLAVLPRDNFSFVTRKLLVCSAQNGSLEMLRVLLDAGADANARDDAGTPALHFASALGRNETVKLLLDRGADSRANSQSCKTALHYACNNGHYSTAAILAAHETRSADTKWLSSWTTCPLILACRSGDVQTVTSLLYYGSSVHGRDEDDRSALHHVLRFNTDRHTKILEHLLAAGAHVEAQDRWEQTPLIVAARSGAYAAVRRLLAAGAKPSAKDMYGNTALDKAKSLKHELLVHLLETASSREKVYLMDHVPPT